MTPDLWIFIGKCVLIGGVLLAIVAYVAGRGAVGDLSDPHR